MDSLYDDVVKDIVKDIVKSDNSYNTIMEKNEDLLCNKDIQEEDLNTWELLYKETMDKILDNKTVNCKKKSILKHFIKQKFTKWFIQYKNKCEVSLTKINLYYE